MKAQAADKLLKNITIIISKYTDIYNLILNKQSKDYNFPQDPLQLNKLFFKLFNNLVNDPDRIIKYQMSFFKGQLEAIEDICAQYYQTTPTKNQSQDKRFNNNLWHEHCAFAWIRRAYFTYSDWIDNIIIDLPKDDYTRLELRRLNFIIKQFIDAASPTNFPLSNPEVLQSFFDSSGESLINGLENLLRDIKNSKFALQIQNNPEENFILGANIAATKGKIIFQNDIIQLIHYQPLTSNQYSLPILIIPPFINKYYIMDLAPGNSLVQWLLEQQYNILMISWINPGEELSGKSFEDYMLEGPLSAINYICQAFKATKINLISYCIGGTLTSSCLAYMKATNDNRVNAACFLTTLIDFAEAGDLSIFIDDHFVKEMERYMAVSGGYLDSNDMAYTFNLLRSNDMIWPFYINNYLLGKEPFPFSILHWNSDGTRMPMELHLYYLRNMYKDNLLKAPNRLILNQIPINISSIEMPCLFVAAKNDHIVPWKNAFDSAKLFSGEVTFVLTDSGHIAGIINHPKNNKYCYWTENNFHEHSDHHSWEAKAQKHSGSWWIHLDAWLKEHSGRLIASRALEEVHSNIIEEAPGSYVKIRY